MWVRYYSRAVVPNLASKRLFATLPTQATVAKYHLNGPPLEVVKLETEPLPALKDNQVLIKMLCAPINPADINMIIGNYPIRPVTPAVGGSEGLGQVMAVGNSATKLKVGDLVLPSKPGLGTWRSHAVVNETDVFALPPADGVKPEYLATLYVNPATALVMLNDFVNLKEGDVIIQNGANSMVGMCALQIAHARGIKSINIIRKRSNYDELVEQMKQYGAYIVCSDDYIRTAEFRQLISDLPKPKLALNCVGGPTATEMVRLLETGGTMVTYGGMSMKPITVPTASFIFNDVTLKGFWMSRWYDAKGEEGKIAVLKELIQLVQQNKLRVWTERHPLSNITTALERAINTSVRDRKVLLSMME